MALTLNLVTERILQSGYPSFDDVETLSGMGFTDFLSVDEAYPARKNFVDLGLRFHHFPITDMAPISPESALGVTKLTRNVLADPKAKICVHCNAGKNRSPTVVWLYLVAEGRPVEVATRMVSKGNRALIVPNELLISELDLPTLFDSK